MYLENAIYMRNNDVATKMGSSSLLEQRQKEDKAACDAYWQLRDLDSRGTVFPRFEYYAQKAFDAPATRFRGVCQTAKY
uniref:Lipoprotein n=1 Tax=Angiostrongylus cantonensis TaxID=6313 RepID=A0A0K0D2V1_ANGCA